VSETLREFALRDLQGLRARHGEVFAIDWRRRAAFLVGIVLAVALEHVPPELNLRGFPWGD
jgi:hypothetical protein